MAQARRARPVLYSVAVADAICEQLAEGQSLRRICTSAAMPTKATIFRWLQIHADFKDKYVFAREVQAEGFVDELMDLIDDDSADMIEGPKGGLGPNRIPVQRAKLQVDTRKWVVAKVLPKKYGDRLAVNVSGELALSERIQKARARRGL